RFDGMSRFTLQRHSITGVSVALCPTDPDTRKESRRGKSMAFHEHLTLCPRCYMQIAIDIIMVDETAIVRVVGDCTNRNCHARNLCFDIDPFESAVESASSQAAPYCPVQSKLWGN